MYHINVCPPTESRVRTLCCGNPKNSQKKVSICMFIRLYPMYMVSYKLLRLDERRDEDRKERITAPGRQSGIMSSSESRGEQT